MHPILESLRQLSEAASSVLPLLERYDYSVEAKEGPDSSLPLSMAPKTLKEIRDEVLRFCCPIITRDDNIPNEALLNRDNMKVFLENMNVTCDRQLAHQFQFVDVEPITAVAGYFEDLQMTKPAHFLRNASDFAMTIRQSYNAAAFGAPGKDLAPIIFMPTYSHDELTENEKDYQDRYAIFINIFAKDGFVPAQRQALFKAFYKEAHNSDDEHPHLVIIAALAYLMNEPSLKMCIKGQFNTVCRTTLTALGLPADKAKNYGRSCLKKTSSPTLFKYKGQASLLVKSAIGHTR